MEGILWTRDGRSKLLRGWHKRYFALSNAGVLREYTSNIKKKELLRRETSTIVSTVLSHDSNEMNGMILQREMDIRGAIIKSLPFPLVGKHHAFQVKIVQSEPNVKLVLCARQVDDVRLWINALRSAALKLMIPRYPSPMGWSREKGLVPGGALARGSFDLDALQLQSSLNMRHLEQAFKGMEKEGDCVFFDEENDSSEEESSSIETALPNLPSMKYWNSAIQSAAYLPKTELIDMLQELQSNGRFVEALQLMQQNSTWRSTYWQQIFDWALTPAQSNEENQNIFKRQIETRLSDEDEAQVQKDIPRTIKWLAGSAGAPKLNDTERALRLEHLKQVLHAFLSSCSLDVRTDEAPVSPSSAGSAPSRSFYMQGMNGLAFILLEVLENDQVEAFRFLRGIVARILPHVVDWESSSQ
ncbi:hypothetical protein F444_10911 [Plasmopara halstedii]|uniref:PH domain-containing protein n=1 Tax=Plasmopara halstedii TaxID=4781 RepID=A0A0P1B593_PLAHL|nr:hypothetical protein F444_10911 [Plasmopara halstedii]CEG48660.1 hypothetical protein F444_10911 [Plasmopara halstedii]|eukprot:XP_024585029.1 hypothetical protein F444_10911 [Plasmopara halstedii]